MGTCDHKLMVSEVTYQAVWDGLLEVSRARHFYFDQERRHKNINFILRFLLAMSGIGAFASIWDIHELVGPTAGTLISALVIIDLLGNFTTRLAQLKIVNLDLASLEQDYRNFWDDTRNGTISNKEASENKKVLMMRLNMIASNVDITASDKILQRIQEDAFRAEEVRYAG